MTPTAPAEHLSAAPNETGPFVLRTLFANVPLSADGTKDNIKINCVEYLDGNLYVGTSDAELLHFVQIPPDPSDQTGSSAFILASRHRPAFAETTGSSPASRPGVQQILPLPQVGKACVLCNSTATFYSLPELSPVFGTQVKNCSWIGGVDLNQYAADIDPDGPDSVAVLLSLSRKIQVVKIGESARVIKNIDFAGSITSVRRDTIACVADSRSYALLEVDRQLKIPLMPISSLDETEPEGLAGQPQNISATAGDGLSRSNSSSQPHRSTPEPHSHRRGTSLGDFITGINRRPDLHPKDAEQPGSRQSSPSPPQPSPSPQPADISAPPARDGTPDHAREPQKPLPPPPTRAKTQSTLLTPLVVSPTPEEFLLVTGTGQLEPGIGMFVNLDGDPTRPTIEFDRYPKQIIVDGTISDPSTAKNVFESDEEGYALASMGRDFEDGLHYGLEIQRWDASIHHGGPAKYWLEPPNLSSSNGLLSKDVGIRSLLSPSTTHLQEIVDKLCQRRFRPFSFSNTDVPPIPLRSVDSRTALSVERVSREKELFERDNDSQDDESLPDDWEAIRNAEEQGFARRLAGTSARLAVWSGSNIWWAIRNPVVLRLDNQLEDARAKSVGPVAERHSLFAILDTFRGREATSELEFWTLNYIRQRAGLLLLTIFLKDSETPFTDREVKDMQNILVEGGLDPRVVVSLVPGVRNEVIETHRGIWIFGGVKRTAEEFITKSSFNKLTSDLSALPGPVLFFLKAFLSSWRQKKDFGSVTDKVEVFRTVDAALLAVLLQLDKQSPPGQPKGRTIRSDLYDLVDSGVDCFDRAETILESHHRLFVLSRLYQSRKMAAEVLATWRRIIEGERDDGNELLDGEQRVRDYLTKVSSQSLVREYGIWLANKNPRLGVKVFAEDKGRAPPFELTQVVEILRSEAPGAVKYYLEHLVFGKGHTTYVNELITYYLDIVINSLRSSSDAREVVMSTYATYRALQPPKPSYQQFLADNAPAGDEAWHSRLRLLQLLGGTYDYDSAAIRGRILSLNETVEDILVPETIILDGRERRHEGALRLLVHRLGDYDTAVAYCLRGGASIYSIYRSPPVPSPAEAAAGPKRRDSAPPTTEQQVDLFQTLLGEFLALENLSDRVEQTSLLLDRFGGWFDVADVLSRIPDSWSVDLVAGFLVKALRRLVGERNETNVQRSLSSSQNLRTQAQLVVKIDEMGPSVET